MVRGPDLVRVVYGLGYVQAIPSTSSFRVVLGFSPVLGLIRAISEPRSRCRLRNMWSLRGTDYSTLFEQFWVPVLVRAISGSDPDLAVLGNGPDQVISVATFTKQSRVPAVTEQSQVPTLSGQSQFPASNKQSWVSAPTGQSQAIALTGWSQVLTIYKQFVVSTTSEWS